MTKVKSSEFQKNVGAYLEKLHKGPVEIVRYNRSIGFLVSSDEFNALVAASRRSIRAADLTERELELLAESTPPEEGSYTLDDIPELEPRKQTRV
ncbi:MAG: hypothetical protein NVV63_12005 [Opitutus sp.]|nr:hypothetical protein [Opitutus sp.]